MSFFVDVHTHLTHSDFADDLETVIARTQEAGLGAVIVNGLEPQSNRMILELSRTHSIIRSALGIYPLDAICHEIPKDFPFKVPVFDVQNEIEFIRSCARDGRLIAIGECGLDGHYLGPEYLSAQEVIFEELIDIALTYSLPLILHSRKCERRVGEILVAHGVKKANFHCFTGRASLAKEYAEKYGWYFSMPANSVVNEGFQKMMRTLPSELILTETDAPYMGPKKGQRNEPANVIGTVGLLAKLRNLTLEQAKDQVFQNYKRLFGD